MVNNIIVNSAQNNSGVFVGGNIQYGWSSHQKESANFSSGQSHGNFYSGNINLVFDNDLFDISNYDSDIFYE